MSERSGLFEDAPRPATEGPEALQTISLPPAIQFDTNLDELVDVNLRFIAGARWGAKQRRRSIAAAILTFAASMFVVITIMGGVNTGSGLLAVAALAIAFSLMFGLVYRSGYDALMRNRLRRVLRDQLGNVSSWRCEIELRRDGAWSRGSGVELLLPWADCAAIDDGDAGVELRFRSGFILARSRAFATAGDRNRFIDAARALTRAHVSNPAGAQA